MTTTAHSAALAGGRMEELVDLRVHAVELSHGGVALVGGREVVKDLEQILAIPLQHRLRK